MERTDLQRLSKEELIDLVLQLQRPKKTSQTSSLPPSLDRKERRENSKPGGGKPGHKGHFRALCQTPDAVRDHVPLQCEQCGAAFGGAEERRLIGEYESIDLPPVRPFVTRHREFACRCAGCGIMCAPPQSGAGTPFRRLRKPPSTQSTRQAGVILSQSVGSMMTWA